MQNPLLVPHNFAKRFSPRRERAPAEQAAYRERMPRARGGGAYTACVVAHSFPSCSLEPAVHVNDAVGLDLERWPPVADAPAGEIDPQPNESELAVLS